MTTPIPDLMPARPEKVERPVDPRFTKWLRLIIVVGLVVPLMWSAAGLEISPQRLWEAPGQIWVLLRGMFPPDWSGTPKTLELILESLYVAWIGTIIGATLSFPLAFLAATNVAPRWITIPVRSFFSAIRAFPELVLAIMFIPAFGLGPFAGTLAIGLHSIGTLGKLSSEVIEGVDDGPIEAIKSSGGTFFQQMRFGVVPQALPTIVAYWLYRFEINIRASAVLGVIGAGGVGAEIVGRLRFRGDWPKAGAVVILTILTVLIIDTASSTIRRRIITGHASTSRPAKWMAAMLGASEPPSTELAKP
jgi:phosphonate transport system permease protein